MSYRRIKSSFLGTLCAVALCGPAWGDAPQRLDIPAGDLVTALETLTKQVDVELVFKVKELKGLKTEGLKGTYPVRDAVEALLKGTGLSVRTDAKGVMLIQGQPSVNGASSGSAADQMRMAQTDDGSPATPPTSSPQSPDDTKNQVTVAGQRDRPKPFASNMDIPRTASDAQPYYIFDSQAISRSGSVTVEEFLKNNLTMNSAFETSGQVPTSQYGNMSTINLRGLGTDKTLILVNGRRIPSTNDNGVELQPDINGTPIGAIERIEVLPTSASGIYGASAIAGAVNVVLKSDYSGGNVGLTYENTVAGDAPTRMLSATIGRSIGKTQVMLTGQWSDAQSLLLRDRRELIDRGIRQLMENSPSSFFASTTPFLGATPNIVRVPNNGTPLVLKPQYGGVPIGSAITTISQGALPGMSAMDLGAMLLQNSGAWNMDLPASTQSPTGLLLPLRNTPTSKSLRLSLRRSLSSTVDGFIEYTHRDNRSESIRNAQRQLTIPASAASSPFTTTVRVTFPSAYTTPTVSASVARGIVGGLNIALPRNWNAVTEYSWADNRLDYAFRFSLDNGALTAAIADGSLNPFVDTLLYPLDFEKFLIPQTYSSKSTLVSFAAKGSGPLVSFPWGTTNLTIGIERRTAKVLPSVREQNFPLSPANDVRFTYFEQQQITDSGYAELDVPLIKSRTYPFIEAARLQLAGRIERYTVDVGTQYFQEYPNDPSRNRYSDGGSVRLTGTDSYSSRNITIGLKLQPVKSIILRASAATAFLPPTPEQLTSDGNQYDSNVVDPVSQAPIDIKVGYGGNPSLVPQNSESLNVGVIWGPVISRLNGLRMNAEFYRISQFDQIGSIGEQAIADREDIYPGRVIRDSAGDIVFVDASLVNLYKLETDGWDVGFDYHIATSRGRVDVRAIQTRILHERRQFTLDSPLLEHAGYVAEGGPGKVKTSISLSWELGGWAAAWAGRYFGAYKQRGAAGGPLSMQFGNGDVYSTTVAAQGSETVSSQMYHDLLIGYSFERNRSARVFSGLTIQGGIKNVFDAAPPFDANPNLAPYYISYYGDKRMRSYWISAQARF